MEVEVGFGQKRRVTLNVPRGYPAFRARLGADDRLDQPGFESRNQQAGTTASLNQEFSALLPALNLQHSATAAAQA